MTDQRIVVRRGASSSKAAFVVTIATVAAGGQGDSIAISPRSSLFTSAASIPVANVFANETIDPWSDPELVIAAYQLETTRQKAIRLANQVFGSQIPLIPSIEVDPESGLRFLTFELRIPRRLRARRYDFEARYAAAVTIAPTAPAPVILWSYSGGNNT